MMNIGRFPSHPGVSGQPYTLKPETPNPGEVLTTRQWSKRATLEYLDLADLRRPAAVEFRA